MASCKGRIIHWAVGSSYVTAGPLPGQKKKKLRDLDTRLGLESLAESYKENCPPLSLFAFFSSSTLSPFRLAHSPFP